MGNPALAFDEVLTMLRALDGRTVSARRQPVHAGHPRLRGPG
jgi:hypothetical protein